MGNIYYVFNTQSLQVSNLARGLYAVIKGLDSEKINLGENNTEPLFC